MKWRCKDGTIMNISEMTDQHLQNAINYSYRNERFRDYNALLDEHYRRTFKQGYNNYIDHLNKQYLVKRIKDELIFYKFIEDCTEQEYHIEPDVGMCTTDFLLIGDMKKYTPVETHNITNYEYFDEDLEQFEIEE